MKDNRVVFFNPTEFSSLHVLNDVILQCVTRRYNEEMSGRQTDHYDGLHGDHMAIQFRADDFFRKEEWLPREGQRVHFDDSWYDVERCENEYGVCRLVLSSYRGAYAL